MVQEYISAESKSGIGQDIDIKEKPPIIPSKKVEDPIGKPGSETSGAKPEQ